MTGSAGGHPSAGPRGRPPVFPEKFRHRRPHPEDPAGTGRRDPELMDSVNHRLTLGKSGGTRDAFYRHWIPGEGAGEAEPPWSIPHHVLLRRTREE